MTIRQYLGTQKKQASKDSFHFRSMLHQFARESRLQQAQEAERARTLSMSSSSKLSKKSISLLQDSQQKPLYFRATGLWKQRQDKLEESRQAATFLKLMNEHAAEQDSL